MAKSAAGFLVYRMMNNQIEYLLLRASYGDFHWSPPKGHIDPGEDDFGTALRETREETGYSAADLKVYESDFMTLKYNVRGNLKTVKYWLAQLLNPEQNPVLSDEHTEFKWLPKEDAKTLTKYEEFKQLIDYFDLKLQQT